MGKIGKIYQYDLDGNFVDEYDNPVEASNLLSGHTTSNIYSSLKGSRKYRTVHNSYWSNVYYKKYPKELMKNPKKQICQYDKDMNLVRIYDRLTDVIKYGFLRASVSSCLSPNHYQKTHKGFIWKYKD